MSDSILPFREVRAAQHIGSLIQMRLKKSSDSSLLSAEDVTAKCQSSSRWMSPERVETVSTRVNARLNTGEQEEIG